MKVQKSLVSAATAVALAATGVTAAGVTTAAAADKTVIDKGHVDVFATDIVDGNLVLNLKDESQGNAVSRAPESVLLKLNQNAWKDAKTFDQYADNFINSSGAYIPQSQDPEVLWSGWSPTKYGNSVTFDFKEVTGPGQVYLYQSRGLNASGKIDTAPLFADRSYQMKSGSQLTAGTTHAHANWVFTKPGTYTMKVTATQGDKVSNTATYTWEVANPEASNAPAPQPTPGKPAEEKSSLDTGGIIGIVLAVVAVLGGLLAAAGGMIPGLNPVIPGMQR